MNANVPCHDAVDLLDADHQAVKNVFIDHGALSDEGAPATAIRALEGVKVLDGAALAIALGRVATRMRR